MQIGPDQIINLDPPKGTGDTDTTISAVDRCRAAVANLNKALADLPSEDVEVDISMITVHSIGAKSARLILDTKFKKVL